MKAALSMPKALVTLIALVAVVCGGLLAHAAAQVGRTTPVPRTLKEQLSKYPGMRLLEPQDISAADCDTTAVPHPGWISADFTGNGRIDFAVLLVSSKSSGHTIFDGRTYSQHEFSLKVFLSKPDGTFDAVSLKQFSDNVPTIKGLKLQPRGQVFDLDSSKGVRLRDPAVTFYSCGQFENVFYWSGSHFDELVTSR